MIIDDDLLNADSVIFDISTTLCSPRLRLPGESATCVLDPAFVCFATLSDPLFIQDRRFIQSYGWWPFFRVPQLSTATSCRTGFSIRQIRTYLHKWAAWWVQTTEEWQEFDLLNRFISSCWNLSLQAAGAGLLKSLDVEPTIRLATL